MMFCTYRLNLLTWGTRCIGIGRIVDSTDFCCVATTSSMVTYSVFQREWLCSIGHPMLFKFYEGTASYASYRTKCFLQGQCGLINRPRWAYYAYIDFIPTNKLNSVKNVVVLNRLKSSGHKMVRCKVTLDLREKLRMKGSNISTVKEMSDEFVIGIQNKYLVRSIYDKKKSQSTTNCNKKLFSGFHSDWIYWSTEKKSTKIWHTEIS